MADTDYTKWAGMPVVDRQGDKVGTVADLYIDEDDSTPAWATVKSGLFGTKRHFVPVELARETDGMIMLDTTMDAIKHAPALDTSDELSSEDEHKLRRHYTSAGDDRATEQRREEAGPTGSMPDTDRHTAGRPEERRADNGLRIRKYVVTETMRVDVPVQREVVELEQPTATPTNDSIRRR